MSEYYPKYFYKYRSIDDDVTKEKKNPLDDKTISALLNNKAFFSSRTNFNDLFDSKIELIEPTPQQLEYLGGIVRKPDPLISECTSDGTFTPKGLQLIRNVTELFNEVIDGYAFFPVSKKSTSNLMWAHYAKSHTGFCIEFKSDYIKADMVSYQDHIPSLNTIDILRLDFGLIDEEIFGKHIWQSLRTKLTEWAYEDEYRFQAGDRMGKLRPGQKSIEFSYTPEFVESIIFGCRMNNKVKEFIAKNMPPNVKFKQAIAKTSTIEIVPWNATLLKTKRTAEL